MIVRPASPSGLLSDTIYLGGISHNTPEGLAGLTIIRVGN